MNNKLLRSLKYSLTKNWGLKLLAIFLSAALWVIVNNITDPVKTRIFTNCTVEIINDEEITDLGKTYEILDQSDTVTVTVSGKNSVVSNLTKDDIRVTADMQNLTMLDTVTLQASSVRNSSDLEFSLSHETLQLSIEDVTQVQMVINTSVSGSPAEGYVVGSVTPSQNIVRISGPESIIEQIDHVNAVAEIAGLYTSDVNTSVELKLYNAEDQEITKSSSIKMNISTVNVAVTILATKEVPLSFVISGEPAAGYMRNGEVISVPETVVLAGRKAALDAVSEMTVQDSALDITDATDDVTNIINIKKYLPTGTSFADSSFNGNVSVTVGVERQESKTLEIPKSNFAVANTPENMEVTIAELDDEDTTQYTISVIGIAADLEQIDAEDIIGVVDMDLLATELGITEWTAGVYQADIVFNLPDDVETQQDYQFTIVMSDPEEEEEE